MKLLGNFLHFLIFILLESQKVPFHKSDQRRISNIGSSSTILKLKFLNSYIIYTIYIFKKKNLLTFFYVSFIDPKSIKVPNVKTIVI